MAMQPPPGAAQLQVVEQVLSALAASETAIELTFDNLEVMLPRDGGPDAPSPRVRLNGTLRLQAAGQ
ncbi:MAG TPA: hypothetical protein VII06_03810 [Chloroflexota bacterium]